MTTTDVLVIGAGPTGLTAANILAQCGMNFRILEGAEHDLDIELTYSTHLVGLSGVPRGHPVKEVA